MEESAVADALPLVSVVILNYRRREALVKSLASARAQEYANLEIIVVDNHSEDGIGEFLLGEAPEVKLIALEENRGACGGRNAGIATARGQIIITLDNDIYFESSWEILKAVKVFAARPDVGVLAFQLCDALTGELRVREWCHPRRWKEFGKVEFETHYF